MVLVATVAVAGITGCKKSTFDINKNPNQATDSTISYNVILPSALNNQAATLATSWGWLQNWLGFWARSGTYAPNTSEETYEVTTSFQSGLWTSLYDNNYDYQTMQIQATKAGADFYAGIARIMKSLNYGILVDFYNNVPYSQALKGGGNTTPKYDKGLDIYNDLFRQIDTGLALIQNANPSASGPNKNILTDDVMFGTSNYPGQTVANEKILWSKFANSLKLRLLIHCTSGGVLVPNATVTGINHTAEFARLSAASYTVGTKTVTNYGYLGAGENAQVNPGFTNTATAKMNPFYYTYVANNAGTPTGNSQYYRANSFAMEYYAFDGDPRAARLYAPGNNGLKGVAYGLPSLTVNAAPELAAVSGPGLVTSSPAGTKAQWVFTGTESLFLQAEAIHRGFLTGNARTTMNAAITESFSFLGATGASTYIANNATYPDVDYNGASQGAGLPAGGLFTIISQKWFALNAIAPYEVYADYRRVNMRNKAGAAVDHFIYAQGGGFVVSASSGYPSTTVGPPISVAPSNTTTQIPSRLLYPQSEYNYNPTNVGLEGTISKNGKVFWDN
jgi:hypothetical protein